MERCASSLEMSSVLNLMVAYLYDNFWTFLITRSLTPILAFWPEVARLVGAKVAVEIKSNLNRPDV